MMHRRKTWYYRVPLGLWTFLKKKISAYFEATKIFALFLDNFRIDSNRTQKLGRYGLKALLVNLFRLGTQCVSLTLVMTGHGKVNSPP